MKSKLEVFSWIIDGRLHNLLVNKVEASLYPTKIEDSNVWCRSRVTWNVPLNLVSSLQRDHENRTQTEQCKSWMAGYKQSCPVLET